MIVRLQHLGELNICHRGGRRMAKLLGLDWDDFVANGIHISKLENVDDINVRKLVKHVRKKYGQQE